MDLAAANTEVLRRDAEMIWRAGVEAVNSQRLVSQVIRRAGSILEICGQTFDLAETGKIVVVGAGKAGAGMAAAFEQSVGEDVLEDKVCGWINVPSDCVRPLEKIHLHAARPAGHNEPTEEGVAGSRKILELVSSLEPRDLCVVMISGGGSALMPAPTPEISLENKQAVTRFLMHAGATINELNCVRKQLSQVKGGGLARAIRAGRTLVLIVSDVIGDPLDVIASGPTVRNSTTAADALAVLDKFCGNSADKVPQFVRDYLAQKSERVRHPQSIPADVKNFVIGNNATALAASAEKATRLGYVVHSRGSDNAGEACTVGRELAELCLSIRDEGTPVAAPACILSGGEPIVHLAQTSQPRKGGRNQELMLASLERLWNDGLRGIAMLSGGTDGEDGPTDAAGAMIDTDILKNAQTLKLQPRDDLEINNSYRFFEQAGGLLKTGPTHTNVMDLRVAVISGSD